MALFHPRQFTYWLLETRQLIRNADNSQRNGKETLQRDLAVQ